MNRRRLLVAMCAAVALALVWLFWPKGEDEAIRHIAGRARLDLVAACNQAAQASGEATRFAAQDIVARAGTDAESGVVALVSVFEARRDGLICKWDGIDPATLTRAQ